MKMEGLPPQKPNKTMEVIKKAARILAVGSTLAGTNPGKVATIEVPKATPNEVVSTEFAVLRGDDPHYVMRPNFNTFRRSANVEDERDKVHTMADLKAVKIGFETGGSSAHTGEQSEAPVYKVGKDGKVIYGPYDKDIEESAKRIKADVEAAQEIAREQERGRKAAEDKEVDEVFKKLDETIKRQDIL